MVRFSSLSKRGHLLEYVTLAHLNNESSVNLELSVSLTPLANCVTLFTTL